MSKLKKEEVWRGEYRGIPFSIKVHGRVNREEHPELNFKHLKHLLEGIWCGYLHLNSRDHPEIDEISREELAELPWHGGLTFIETTYDVEEYTLLKVGCDFAHLRDDELSVNEDLVEVSLKDVIDVYRDKYPDKDDPKFLKALEEVEKEPLK